MKTYPLFSDEYFMSKAFEQAEIALDKEEIPIGAVIVINNKIIAKAHNLTQTLKDATAHAEMLAITSATSYLGAKYLFNSTIYITLEPCSMCAGAIYWSKIYRIIYGADDPKTGFTLYEKILNTKNVSLIHPKTEIYGGILQNQCSTILNEFFEKKRNIQ